MGRAIVVGLLVKLITCSIVHRYVRSMQASSIDAWNRVARNDRRWLCSRYATVPLSELDVISMLSGSG